MGRSKGERKVHAYMCQPSRIQTFRRAFILVSTRISLLQYLQTITIDGGLACFLFFDQQVKLLLFYTFSWRMNALPPTVELLIINPLSIITGVDCEVANRCGNRTTYYTISTCGVSPRGSSSIFLVIVTLLAVHAAAGTGT